MLKAITGFGAGDTLVTIAYCNTFTAAYFVGNKSTVNLLQIIQKFYLDHTNLFASTHVRPCLGHTYCSSL